MKRTPEYFNDRTPLSDPYPKSIRIKTLRKVVAINHALNFFMKETGLSIYNLTEKPEKHVEFIMKNLKISKRTAYDYYTALLYIHHQLFAISEYTIKRAIDKQK